MHSYVFPGDLDKEIAAVGSQPIPYMRTEEFSKINLESERILLDLIHCHGGRTIIYTGSGTGAMSAVVENYVSTKGKALAINGGSFGRRWVSLCEYYGVPVVDFKVPFAKDIDYDELEERIGVTDQEPDYVIRDYELPFEIDEDMMIEELNCLCQMVDELPESVQKNIETLLMEYGNVRNLYEHFVTNQNSVL